jgi:hypothetical protein
MSNGNARVFRNSLGTSSAAQPASGGPAGKRDEGPGGTEGVSPGAILRPVETKRPRTNPGPERMGLGCFLSCRLFLCCSFRGCCLGLVRTLGLGFDGLGLLWCEHLLGLGEQVRLAFMGNTDVVGEDEAQGEAGYRADRTSDCCQLTR